MGRVETRMYKRRQHRARVFRGIVLLLLLLALVYLGACVLRLQKTCESIWEADPSWN